MSAATELPCVLASTVVRGARKGDAHGGLYVVDLAFGEQRRVLEWREDIDYGGRGGDRGLRGVAVRGERIFVAASAEILELTPAMEVVARYRSPHLGLAHEICLRGDYLFVVSTAFDSLLALDLVAGRFTWGLCIRGRGEALEAEAFKPGGAGPAPGDLLHLNQVALLGEDLYLSGTRSPCWLRLRGDALELVGYLPPGTHTVLPLEDGRVYNDTAMDRVVLERGEQALALAVPRYPVGALAGLDPGNGPLARQAFARGLLYLADDCVIGGSSPSTVTAYDFDSEQLRAQVTLTMDVRHAVHGIEIWPFD